jgi:hypothetical protein
MIIDIMATPKIVSTRSRSRICRLIPVLEIGTTTIPLELTVVRKKQHKATHSVVIDPNFLQINTTSFFYQFQKEMKFEATLSCILESGRTSYLRASQHFKLT